MPTYEYACTECGDRLEVVQRFSDDPLTVCAACGGKLRKVFSPVGIVFKGSGFYRTDSRNGGVAGRRQERQRRRERAPRSDSNGGRFRRQVGLGGQVRVRPSRVGSRVGLRPRVGLGLDEFVAARRGSAAVSSSSGTSGSSNSGTESVGAGLQGSLSP